MQEPAILILGDAQSRRLADRVFDAGFAPIVRSDLHHALRTLRRERCVGVVVDLEHSATDVLEFVLNVKDLAPAVPVWLAGKGDKPGNRMPMNPDNVFSEHREAIPGKLSDYFGKPHMDGLQTARKETP